MLNDTLHTIMEFPVKKKNKFNINIFNISEWHNQLGSFIGMLTQLMPSDGLYCVK